MSEVKKPPNRVWNPEAECMPRKELNALPWKRLREVVQTAWERVPCYRVKMEAAGVKPGDIRLLEDVVKLPFTMKDEG